VLIQPNHPAAATWGALAVFPLELPVILLALAALGPGAAGRHSAFVLVAVLVTIAVLKTADFAAFTALSRGFNPVADMPLVDASIRLLAGTVGPLATTGIVAALVLVVGLVAAALWWATGVWARIGLPTRAARLSGAVAVLAAGVAAAEIAEASRLWSPPFAIPGAAFTARVGIERVEMAGRTVVELRAFRAAAAADPFATDGPLLDAIDRDVMIVFVESYGRTSIDTPFFAELHRDTLAAAEARLADLGLAMRSGFVASPTRGGQSWLAHATLANGLRIDDQTRYGGARQREGDAVPHRGAVGLPDGGGDARHHARLAGIRPHGVRDCAGGEGPRLPGPALQLGDDAGPVHAGRSRPAFAHGRDPRPLFVQVALVSSHAPWVPVPVLLDWDASATARCSTRSRPRAIRPTSSGATPTGCARNTGSPSTTRSRPSSTMPPGKRVTRP
jgi:hypothetical protein